MVKAKVGVEGGKATARTCAASLAPKSQDTREEAVLKETAEAEIPPVEEFCERFARTFLNHLPEFTASPSHARTIEKDLPMMLNYVNEKHDCNNCLLEAYATCLLNSIERNNSSKKQSS